MKNWTIKKYEVEMYKSLKFIGDHLQYQKEEEFPKMLQSIYNER